MLYADKSQSLLIILQAMDAGGKDGTIKHVFTGVNPQGVHVNGFKRPSEEELAHDFLWRVHQHAPKKGYIGIFNRSHYEDVLVVRVNNLVPKFVWEKRYDHINNFERQLFDAGTRILKFYLHIDRDEQKERFEDRLQRPDKNWKFARGDLDVRRQWDDYMRAYEDAITKCNTAYAPWHIVPANRKWYRNYVVMKTIIETLEDMNLSYPDAEPDLDQIVID
jgi:PPK2 family polyphosphate:nucleotide phosphotransferase